MPSFEALIRLALSYEFVLALLCVPSFENNFRDPVRRMLSLLNSATVRQGGLQVSRYIPAANLLGLMPWEVAMKCTLRHILHMMPR